MGLCLCTYTYPIGGVLGCVSESIYGCENCLCPRPSGGFFDTLSPTRRFRFYVGLVLLGSIFYIALTLQCSTTSGEPWEIWYRKEKGGGCWSQFGAMNYKFLGVLAGLLLGVGSMSLVLWLLLYNCHSCRQIRKFDQEKEGYITVVEV